MKVYIGPYKNWFGPYQLAEKLLFWLDKHEDKRVHKFGEWLATGKVRVDNLRTGSVFKDEEHETWLYKFLKWIDSKKKRTVRVRIDKYDTWSMDNTLSYIILPMLKQLKATKHGSPSVEDEDVPEGIGLRSTEAPPKENEWDTDSSWHKRWEWVLDEMIWTFEQNHADNDWETQYHSGVRDMQWEVTDRTYPNPTTGVEEPTYKMVTGPNDTHVWDMEGHKKHYARMQNGMRLFGKYYYGLWD